MSTKKVIPMVEELNQIRKQLEEDRKSFRSGKMSPAGLNALTNSTGKTMSSVKLTLEIYKLSGLKQAEIARLTGSQMEVGVDK